MTCKQFETDGMKFLDGEMTPEGRVAYEAHVRTCEHCGRELREMGRIVGFTNELRLKSPDREFWASYWKVLHRRLERGTGFLLLTAGTAALAMLAVYKAATSPELFTLKGLALSAVVVGLVVLLASVARERYYESRSDPYKEIEQ